MTKEVGLRVQSATVRCAYVNGGRFKSRDDGTAQGVPSILPTLSFHHAARHPHLLLRGVLRLRPPSTIIRGSDTIFPTCIPFLIRGTLISSLSGGSPFRVSSIPAAERRRPRTYLYLRRRDHPQEK